MNTVSGGRTKWILLAGDAAALFLAVYSGFQFHGTEEVWATRLQFTFLPWLAAWLLAAYSLGLYEAQTARSWRQAWRVFLAAVLASPLAAVLRAAWLSSTAIPLFVLIMGLVSAFAILVWRMLYLALLARRFAANE